MKNSLKSSAFLQNAFGAILGPQDCSLVLRGIKTLHVRLEHSAAGANKIAHFLQEHTKVQNVYYPGLQSHLGFVFNNLKLHQLELFYLSLYNPEDALRQFLSKVKLPVFAVSLGVVESILSYPAKMSHAALSQELVMKEVFLNSLLRLSVGLENVDDLISDFENALSYVEEPVNA